MKRFSCLHWIFLALPLFFVPFFLTGCSPEKENSGEKPICASFYLLKDLAQMIAGDKMEIICVMPPGADVHSWEPSPRKIMEMSQAGAFLFNGAGLETWTEKVVPQIQKKKVPTFEAALSVSLSGTHECAHAHSGCTHDAHETHSGCTHDAHETHSGCTHDAHETHSGCTHDAHETHSGGTHDAHETHSGCTHDAHETHSGCTHTHAECSHGHAHSGPDPHIWLSIRNVERILTDITKFLSGLDPENAEYFHANLEKCLVQCRELDAEFQTITQSLKSRKLVVAHRAFGYLCQDYGLEQVGLEGYSAYSDPSPAQMVKIIEFIRANQIPVIYAASTESSKGADAIARETGVKVGILDPLGTLTQEQIDAGANYFSVMRKNLEALKLLGTADALELNAGAEQNAKPEN